MTRTPTATAIVRTRQSPRRVVRALAAALAVVAFAPGPSAFAAAPAGVATAPLSSVAAEAAAPAGPGTVARLAVQVSGRYADSFDASARPLRGEYVVGAVATTRLGFVGAASDATITQGQSFAFTVACASESGAGCATGTKLRWDFGDGARTVSILGQPNPGDVTPKVGGGTVGSALTQYHAYTAPGAFTVRVSVDDTATPAYGSGAIKALVSPRFADVDAAYTATAADGTALPGKGVNATSEAVWAVAALGLMPACRPWYAATSSSAVTGERAEDPGRAVFCPSPGVDPVGTAAGAKTLPVANAAPRSQYTPESWTASGARYANDQDCLAVAFNCGLPTSVFASNGTPKGSPLAECTGKCLTVLTNRKILTSAANPQLWYDPTNCADNSVAMYDPEAATPTVTLKRGVEPGCASRGEFMRALVAGVDGGDIDTLTAAATPSAAGGTDVALDARTCAGPDPDRAGRDGVRRAAALLGGAAAGLSPCGPDAALTKGEAYRMLAAAMSATGSSSVNLADLDDRSLGYGASAEPYPYRAAVSAVLAGGAPLVGSSSCPVTPRNGVTAACFNPYQALTRADAATLLSYFVLGESSDVAAVQVRLSADTTSANIGETVGLRLSVSAPSWRLPFQANWQLGLGDSVPARTATFACSTTGSKTMTESTMTQTCPLVINRQPAGGRLPVVVTLNGVTYPATVISVTNTAPVITSVSVPTTVMEDGPAGTMTVTFSDPENNTVSALQVAPSASGPWSDLAETLVAAVRTETLDNDAATATLSVTGQPEANGPYQVYLRACDIGDACSPARAVAGSVTAVNDAPIAFPVTAAPRADQLLATGGDCSAAQADPLPAGMIRLRGDDPLDTGWGSYATAAISTYTVTAPSTPGAGALYVCGSGNTWTPATAAGTTTRHSAVLWNPTVGQYTTSTYSYTVTDAGTAPGGLVSTPQPITVTNTRPGVAPTALLDVDVTTGTTYSTDFSFNGSRSHDGGDVAAIVSYAFDYGDGTSTSAQSGPVLAHRYTSPGTYTATLTVTDAEGLTATATATVTVKANLIGNPTFEVGTDQWNPSGASGVGLSSSSTNPHGGLRLATISKTTTAATCQVTHTPPLTDKATTAGYQYRTTAWVRPTVASAGSQLTLNVTETDGGSTVGNLSTSVTLGVAGKSPVWQQVPLLYTAARSGSSLAVTIGLTNFTGTACFDLDDVSMSGDPQPAPSAVSLTANPGNPTTTALLSTSGGVGATSWKIERSTSSAMTSPVQVCAASTGCSASGLTSGTTYYFRASATNTTGTVSSAPVAFVAGLPSPVTPTVSGTVSAEAVSWVTTAGESYTVSKADTASGPFSATTCATPATAACTFAGSSRFYFKVTSTNTAGTVTGPAGVLP